MIAEFRKVADGKISRGLAARNLGINENTCRKKYNKWAASELGVVAAVVAQSKAQKASTGLSGISLNQVRSTTTKPQETCRARFFELEAGKAYVLTDAAREWGVATDTLRKHAKDMGAFLYVEVSPENWQPAIIRPKGGVR
jgi:hypothetical protein